MTTFASALRLCGLTHSEAADFLNVRIDTLKSWSAGRNPVPTGVWQDIAELWRKIESGETGGLPSGAIEAHAAVCRISKKIGA